MLGAHRPLVMGKINPMTDKLPLTTHALLCSYLSLSVSCMLRFCLRFTDVLPCQRVVTVSGSMTRTDEPPGCRGCWRRAAKNRRQNKTMRTCRAGKFSDSRGVRTTKAVTRCFQVENQSNHHSQHPQVVSRAIPTASDVTTAPACDPPTDGPSRRRTSVD